MLHVYLAAVGAIGVWAGTALFRAALPPKPSALERALPRPAPVPPAVAELERVRREVFFAATTEFDFHVRLRPLLREVVAQRLWSRRGIDMGDHPAAARRAMGEEMWRALTEEVPVDRSRRGPPLPDLERLVAAVEGL